MLLEDQGIQPRRIQTLRVYGRLFEASVKARPPKAFYHPEHRRAYALSKPGSNDFHYEVFELVIHKLSQKLLHIRVKDKPASWKRGP